MDMVSKQNKDLHKDLEDIGFSSHGYGIKTKPEIGAVADGDGFSSHGYGIKTKQEILLIK